MKSPHINKPNRPKPFLVDAYNGYFGTLSEFRTIIVRFWKCRSPMYNDTYLLCSAFPDHVLASANNGYMNEFQIRSLEECYKYYDIWLHMEFCMRNWKYCECHIGNDLVYLNELDCYIRNILKGTNFTEIKQLRYKSELKFLRGKWVNEKLLYDIVKSLFPDYTIIFHFRAEWLEHLELDIYIKEISTAIEYQGIQHYEIINHWGGAEGLKHRQLNDARKKKLCEDMGVKLLYFDYTEKISHEYVKRKILTSLKNIL